MSLSSVLECDDYRADYGVFESKPFRTFMDDEQSIEHKRYENIKKIHNVIF